ncbi:hypothetical protein MSWHS_3277 [Methanosarcina sp. WWM596]|nr:hypothetical protein MSWHS_3277 [Methanosarcina sp. WWM596]
MKEGITGCQAEMVVVRWVKAGKAEDNAEAEEELVVRKGHAYALNADTKYPTRQEFPVLKLNVKSAGPQWSGSDC